MNYNDKNLCCRLVFMMICICYFCTENMTQDADPVITILSNRSLQTYTSNTSLVIKATKAINVMESNKLHSPFFRTGIVIASPSATTVVTKTITASPSTNYTSSTTQSISSRKPSSTGETVIMVIFAVLAFIVLILVISTLTLVRSYWILLFYLVFFEDSLQFHVIFRYILEVRVLPSKWLFLWFELLIAFS